jgi:hypothetical protein
MSSPPPYPGVWSGPPDGFTVPLPYVIRRRVTTDFPHVPRPPADGLAAALAVLWLGGCAIVAGIAGWLGTAAAGWGAFAIVVVAAVVFTVTVWARVNGGPLLAATPWGLWVRTRPGPGQAIWLPWVAIASMQTRRRGNRTAFVITPRDPTLGRMRLGVWTALAGGWQHLVFGRGFAVRVSLADRWTREVLAMALHYASVDVPPIASPKGTQL